MICVTTHTIERHEILSYCGIVAAEILDGAGGLDEIGATLRDGWGGRVKGFETIFAKSRGVAVEAITKKAEALGANAIVAVKFSYQSLGANGGILMVAVSGTAVVITKTEAEKLADQAFAAQHEPEYFLMLAGGEKGPFSIAQLRELVAKGAVDVATAVRADGQAEKTGLEELIASANPP